MSEFTGGIDEEIGAEEKENPRKLQASRRKSRKDGHFTTGK